MNVSGRDSDCDRAKGEKKSTGGNEWKQTPSKIQCSKCKSFLLAHNIRCFAICHGHKYAE